MAILPLPPDQQKPSTDSTISRNATKVNIALRLPQGGWARVGRVQSFTQNIANNVQVLSELGSQFAVELKKGITTFTFSIAKFYVHSDVFDQLRSGAIFGLEVKDYSAVGSGNTGQAVILERFNQCSITSIDRTYTTGQATVAQNAQVVTIGKGAGSPD